MNFIIDSFDMFYKINCTCVPQIIKCHDIGYIYEVRHTLVLVMHVDVSDHLKTIMTKKKKSISDVQRWR